MPARILVVDDYPVVRKTICDLLHSHSLDVCGEAENGQDAVERFKELQPNLVLLRYKHAQDERHSGRFRDSPVIALDKDYFSKCPRMLC